MFFVACVIFVISLLSRSHAAPLACEDLVRTVDQPDRHHWQGRWALVAGSLNDSKSADGLKTIDSVVFYIHNFSYTHANGANGQCLHLTFNTSLEGHVYTMKTESSNFTLTLIHTSCQDCLVLNHHLKATYYERRDLYLLSKRREVDQKEMEEFRAQLECLKMPLPVVMDPSKELCPEQPAAETDGKAGEGKV